MPAISNKAIRDKIRECKTLNSGNSELPDINRELNPKLRGCKNYYGKFYKSKLDHTLTTATSRLARWAQKKYKKLHKKFKRALEWVGQYKNPSHYF
jgi:RNA-directed DNA polymerase